MTYKEYTITAEVRAYQAWSINSEGEIVEPIFNGTEDIEVCGYNVYDENDSWVEYSEGSNIEHAKQIVDRELAG
ncbi:hypothetical protein AB0280_17655 [Pseudarthrobacter sp902506025]|uniref:hypothetical protein n=1 Tax=Pseudarthrobacter sp. 902506025 TaxID=3155291 RepID=UPI00344F4F59